MKKNRKKVSHFSNGFRTRIFTRMRKSARLKRYNNAGSGAITHGLRSNTTDEDYGKWHVHETNTGLDDGVITRERCRKRNGAAATMIFQGAAAVVVARQKRNERMNVDKTLTENRKMKARRELAHEKGSLID